MTAKRTAHAVGEIIIAPFAVAFMFAYGAWCRRSYDRSIRKAGS